MSGGSGSATGQDAVSARVELERSLRYCRGIGEQIRESLVQELAAELLRLQAAALGEVGQAEREAMETRAQSIEGAARLLEAVAERLEGEHDG